MFASLFIILSFIIPSFAQNTTNTTVNPCLPSEDLSNKILHQPVLTVDRTDGVFHFIIRLGSLYDLQSILFLKIAGYRYEHENPDSYWIQNVNYSTCETTYTALIEETIFLNHTFASLERLVDGCVANVQICFKGFITMVTSKEMSEAGIAYDETYEWTLPYILPFPSEIYTGPTISVMHPKFPVHTENMTFHSFSQIGKGGYVVLEGTSYSEWPYRLLPEGISDSFQTARFYENKGFQPRAFSFISIGSLILLNATLRENCPDYTFMYPPALARNTTLFPQFTKHVCRQKWLFEFYYEDNLCDLDGAFSFTALVDCYHFGRCHNDAVRQEETVAVFPTLSSQLCGPIIEGLGVGANLATWRPETKVFTSTFVTGELFEARLIPFTISEDGIVVGTQFLYITVEQNELEAVSLPGGVDYDDAIYNYTAIRWGEDISLFVNHSESMFSFYLSPKFFPVAVGANEIKIVKLYVEAIVSFAVPGSDIVNTDFITTTVNFTVNQRTAIPDDDDVVQYLGTTAEPEKEDPFEDASLIVPLSLMVIACILSLGLFTIYRRKDRDPKPAQVLTVPIPVPVDSKGGFHDEADFIDPLQPNFMETLLPVYESESEQIEGLTKEEEEQETEKLTLNQKLLDIFTSLPKTVDTERLIPTTKMGVTPMETKTNLFDGIERVSVSESEGSEGMYNIANIITTQEDATTKEPSVSSSELESVAFSVGSAQSSYSTPDDLSDRASQYSFRINNPIRDFKATASRLPQIQPQDNIRPASTRITEKSHGVYTDSFVDPISYDNSSVEENPAEKRKPTTFLRRMSSATKEYTEKQVEAPTGIRDFAEAHRKSIPVATWDFDINDPGKTIQQLWSRKLKMTDVTNPQLIQVFQQLGKKGYDIANVPSQYQKMPKRFDESTVTGSSMTNSSLMDYATLHPAGESDTSSTGSKSPQTKVDDTTSTGSGSEQSAPSSASMLVGSSEHSVQILASSEESVMIVPEDHEALRVRIQDDGHQSRFEIKGALLLRLHNVEVLMNMMRRVLPQRIFSVVPNITVLISKRETKEALDDVSTQISHLERKITQTVQKNPQLWRHSPAIRDVIGNYNMHGGPLHVFIQQMVHVTRDSSVSGDDKSYHSVSDSSSQREGYTHTDHVGLDSYSVSTDIVSDMFDSVSVVSSRSRLTPFQPGDNIHFVVQPQMGASTNVDPDQSMLQSYATPAPSFQRQTSISVGQIKPLPRPSFGRLRRASEESNLVQAAPDTASVVGSLKSFGTFNADLQFHGRPSSTRSFGLVTNEQFHDPHTPSAKSMGTLELPEDSKASNLARIEEHEPTYSLILESEETDEIQISEGDEVRISESSEDGTNVTAPAATPDPAPQIVQINSVQNIEPERQVEVRGPTHRRYNTDETIIYDLRDSRERARLGIDDWSPHSSAERSLGTFSDRSSTAPPPPPSEPPSVNSSNLSSLRPPDPWELESEISEMSVAPIIFDSVSDGLPQEQVDFIDTQTVSTEPLPSLPSEIMFEEDQNTVTLKQAEQTVENIDPKVSTPVPSEILQQLDEFTWEPPRRNTQEQETEERREQASFEIREQADVEEMGEHEVVQEASGGADSAAGDQSSSSETAI